MKLFTYNRNPRMLSENTTDVINRLTDTGTTKFVAARSQGVVSTIIFPTRDTHSTIGPTFAEGLTAEICGGGFIIIDIKRKEVQQVYFSSDSLIQTSGSDRPESQEEAATILEEIRSEVNQLLATP